MGAGLTGLKAANRDLRDIPSIADFTAARLDVSGAPGSAA
jgi:hypothetical protein